jgi:hypothetical protein
MAENAISAQSEAAQKVVDAIRAAGINPREVAELLSKKATLRSKRTDFNPPKPATYVDRDGKEYPANLYAEIVRDEALTRLPGNNPANMLNATSETRENVKRGHLMMLLVIPGFHGNVQQRSADHEFVFHESACPSNGLKKTKPFYREGYPEKYQAWLDAEEKRVAQLSADEKAKREADEKAAAFRKAEIEAGEKARFDAAIQEKLTRHLSGKE